MALNIFDLTGRVAIVTGASSGFGVTFAHGLADAGADVVVAARRLEKLNKTAEGVRERGCRCLVVQTDVTKPEQVDNLVNQTVKEFGKVDILVNNAGQSGGRGGVADEATLEDLNSILLANLASVFICTQRVSKEMLARGYGRIINISSVQGVVGSPTIDPSLAYVTSKHGMQGLTKEYARQWAQRGVTVNAIAPAYFPTEMTARYLDNPEIKKAISALAPMGRVGRPEELLGALIFLASDASSYVTGHTILVDGGLTIW
ncbi:MAG: SDR family NAD(P)-dependent oxidoreductase [Dehalococcoidia bacterium]